MRTITAKTKAWMSSGMSPRDFDDQQRAIDRLVFLSLDMSDMGYTLVGEAEITVRVPDEDALIAGKVEMLRSQAKAVRAAAEAKCTEIEGEIQKLLAISYAPEAAL